MDEEKRLWGGVFAVEPADEFLLFSSSIEEDKILYSYEIALSIAHAKILAREKIINESQLHKIISALKEIGDEIAEGKFEFTYKKEDIHTHIEMALKEKIGRIAEKLHVGRSRNEQIATILRMYLKDEVKSILKLMIKLITLISNKSKEYKEVPMPLYTHLRAGEVSLFSVWFLSYNAGLQRDCLRFLDIYSRLDMMPAGVAAGAGSSLNLDRNYLASLLNFSSFMINPTDAVGTRDFILEFIFCCLSILLNLSRLSEELIIFSSPNFNFFELPQRYCSGSSIMPHKINPDLLELTRARCSLISGYFSSLATILKGLPSSYQRDLQEDKRCLFPTVTITKETLEIFPNFLDELRINQRALEEASKEFSLYSTELVNYLVKKGLTQRRAHFIVGNLIKEMKKKNLKKFTLPLLKTISNLFKRDVLELLKYQNVIEKKGLREVVEKQLVSSAAFISSLEGWLKRN